MPIPMAAVPPAATIEVMISVAAPTRRRHRPLRRRRPGRAPPRVRAPRQPLDLEALGDSWWKALDAADAAVRAAPIALPPAELGALRYRLAQERETTIRDLDSLARTRHEAVRFGHLSVSRSNLRALLGLPARISACVFNLDGVLIGSAALHAAAWKETFDELIAARLARSHGLFAPFNSLAAFDVDTDYPKYIHGRPRLDGVRTFLASRGISLPEGAPGDPPGTETVHGLANRKNEALGRRLEEQGVRAFEGSRRYLQLARDAGVRRAVVSASAHTAAILENAGLAGLIEGSVDGNAIVAGRLRARPAPDILLAACRDLDVRPAETAVFETSPAGVAAGRAGGFGLVIGVGTEHLDALREAGADLVVSGLAELLERRSAA